MGDWLERIDPNATRVPLIHFVGPLMGSLQMRPGPQQLFKYEELPKNLFGRP